jgi:hypothetical protein
MRSRSLQFSGDAGKGVCSVDQDFGFVSLSGWSLPSRPPAQGRVECAFPSDPLQPPPMMTTDGLGDTVCEPAFSSKQKIVRKAAPAPIGLL